MVNTNETPSGDDDRQDGEWYDDEVRLDHRREAPEARAARLAALKEIIAKLRAEGELRAPWRGGGREEDGVFSLAYPDIDSVAYQAMPVVYDHGMVVFSWPQWGEGWRIYEGLTPESIGELDLITTLKLLSALARSERFGDDTWAEVFESGHGLLLFEHWLNLEREGAQRPVTLAPTAMTRSSKGHLPVSPSLKCHRMFTIQCPGGERKAPSGD